MGSWFAGSLVRESGDCVTAFFHPFRTTENFNPYAQKNQIENFLLNIINKMAQSVCNIETITVYSEWNRRRHKQTERRTQRDDSDNEEDSWKRRKAWKEMKPISESNTFRPCNRNPSGDSTGPMTSLPYHQYHQNPTLALPVLLPSTVHLSVCGKLHSHLSLPHPKTHY